MKTCTLCTLEYVATEAQAVDVCPVCQMIIEDSAIQYERDRSLHTGEFVSLFDLQD